MKDPVDKKRQAAYPGQPWLWRDDWACGRLIYATSSWAKRLTILFVFALPHAFVWFMAIWGLQVEGFKISLILPALFFLVITGGLLVATIRSIQEERKYGGYALELDSTPAILGGTFSSAIRVKAFAVPEHGFTATLTCTRLRMQTTIGANQDLWETSVAIPREQCRIDGEALLIPLSIPLPPDEEIDGNDIQTRFRLSHKDKYGIQWSLDVKAQERGVNFTAGFVIPVFRVKHPTQIIRHAHAKKRQ